MSTSLASRASPPKFDPSPEGSAAGDAPAGVPAPAGVTALARPAAPVRALVRFRVVP